MDFNADLFNDLPVLLAQQSEPFRRLVACALAKEPGVSPVTSVLGRWDCDASRNAMWFGNTKQAAF